MNKAGSHLRFKVVPFYEATLLISRLSIKGLRYDIFFEEALRGFDGNGGCFLWFFGGGNLGGID